MPRFQPSQQSYGAGFALTYPFYDCVWIGAKDSNSHDAVSALVNALHDKGYAPRNQPRIPSGWTTKLDVLFDMNIRDAVIRFQQANNIKADGVVGAKTWSALGLGGWTGANLKDCPRCAGNFPFGESPSYDCESARPPTPQELQDRATKATEITGLQWEPGATVPTVTPSGDPALAAPPKPPKDSSAWMWWAGGGLIVAGGLTFAYLRYSRKA